MDQEDDDRRLTVGCDTTSLDIPAGQDLRDPLLSAYFAPREAFPKRIWILGCERKSTVMATCYVMHSL